MIHGKRQHTVAEITEAVNGTPSGLFHQYREVPERTGQIAPKVPRHLTMKVTSWSSENIRAAISTVRRTRITAGQRYPTKISRSLLGPPLMAGPLFLNPVIAAGTPS